MMFRKYICNIAKIVLIREICQTNYSFIAVPLYNYILFIGKHA